ncbi:hypothetical protein A2W14_07110 [Candidatus Gottesmanbacteria bacterium RBG_16_37_8]|uniref:Glycosyltransferase 2-like domain-containing protein n=1 Tax=Candidatus Gottesmanbacteria bacterium RBG_16_37_8 TaxID=1798371 RepID=A0A1F5YVX1_9BACT|nr:MAG: hypothetical protein A2W14_07110 [Candidatus Gottesmanbacteria bacterium RBG_16_37_8]
MAKQLLLEVIIVNFNTASLLKKCLDSLILRIKNEGLFWSTLITVVDNGSKDNSLDLLKKHYPRVNLIVNKGNPGFASANNQAIRKSGAEFIFLLNSDTQIGNNVLSSLLKEMNSRLELGVCGPKLINPDGSLQQSIGFSPNLSRIFYWMLFIDDLPYLSRLIKPFHARNPYWYGQKRFVDWLSGAALLFRASLCQSVGFLDDNIFMYGEEVEWCYRIRKANFQVCFLPQIEVVHLKGGSQVNKGSAIIEEYRSLVYFYQKHFPHKIFLLKLLLKVGALLRLILFGIISRQTPKLKLYAQAFKMAG